MPGLFVALVSCGAQVMTVIGSSPAPPEKPGTAPHPTASDAHATRAAAVRRALTRLVLAGLVLVGLALAGLVRVGRNVLRMRRLPVMYPHDSATSLTRE
ncbi:hypothetical protein SSP24_63050 [Streptomyces spinoverrucosus]|uniref:Uncharacterized protein n=1 Tax=Streptomyces spinoverrucosus TaxID=284043 RepID=A0A4Y3VSL8_9ACTN|nr:hypothetical protein SSP24_63050 [Streptomyces spinoverrucosus]GHB53859.1 hypothetical protein GCM10010397_25050 [Streptomyces spinoverrucosus]